MFQLDPITKRKFARFRSIPRGYYSFLVLAALVGLSLFAELLLNNRALVVRYNGELHFPTYTRVRLGAEFGLTGVKATTPVNYRELAKTFKDEGAGNFVLMPLIPYGPNETIPYQGVFKPAPPSLERKNYLGTDSTGRDVLVRAVYGFRTAFFFAMAFTVMTYLVGTAIGSIMGYFGGVVDLVGQRLIEIWSNIPFLYMVIIVFSVVPSTYTVPVRIGMLLCLLVLFSWIGLTYYVRTGTYREKSRDYVAAAVVMGAGSPRILFKHILPNQVSTLVTFIPFTLESGMMSITALDFLGFGLPPPTPSIGELLRQGTASLSIAPWILVTAFATLTITLTLITFVGEAIREAFDPRKFSYYN